MDRSTSQQSPSAMTMRETRSTRNATKASKSCKYSLICDKRLIKNTTKASRSCKGSNNSCSWDKKPLLAPLTAYFRKSRLTWLRCKRWKILQKTEISLRMLVLKTSTRSSLSLRWPRVKLIHHPSKAHTTARIIPLLKVARVQLLTISGGEPRCDFSNWIRSHPDPNPPSLATVLPSSLDRRLLKNAGKWTLSIASTSSRKISDRVISDSSTMNI